MVCELEGPTPILYRSKRLVVTDVIVVSGREQGQSLVVERKRRLLNIEI
jgi:hypothetical protein